MSSGHRHADGHPIRAGEARELAQAMADPRVHAAVAAYTGEDDSHDVPDLGGSDNAGHSILFDQGFVAAIKAGRFMYDGQPFDPRPFLRVHGAVEGALIRILGFDYVKAHLLATIAERHAVEASGRAWDAYESAFRPFIRATEAETQGNWPPDLLLAPYKGTKLYAILAAAQNHGPGQIVLPAAPATAAPVEAPAMDGKYAAEKPAEQDLHHQRMAIGGAHHAFEAGHITDVERDRIQGAARAKLEAAKPVQPEGKAVQPVPAPAAPMQGSGRTPPARPFGALG